ncbi:hypothetical protein AB0K60_00550 [Thermopolyspora sp. NPDC052614]|uniref:hypothetical protein n=1 Tax=Thermopolyspora sp. NPDC052614 TaxID=3155682 RepID=UPI00341AF21F
MRPGDAKLAKAYLYGVFDCLNKTWSAQLKKSGQTFRVPILKVVTKAPKRFCAHRWAKDTVSNYCEANRTILTVLTEEILEDPSDLWMYNLLASDYGQHVQNLTDIYAAYEDHSYRNKKELLEQNRRYELQSICFAGAFVRSTWDSLKRPTSDWPYVVKLFSDDWSAPDFGSRRSISYWANRGFSSGDPGSCNTWTASSKRVA